MSKIRILSDMLTMDESGNVLHVLELAGPSTDSKPTENVANGSFFIETDTGKISIYDETNGWGEAQ